jgi:putative SOS response-associated peptidase YedK
MCGRYSAADTLSELAKLIDFICRAPFFATCYNIAPRQPAPVIVLEMDKWIANQASQQLRKLDVYFPSSRTSGLPDVRVSCLTTRQPDGVAVVPSGLSGKISRTC